MVDVLLVVRDDGSAAARRLAAALRALVEQRLAGVPGLACLWGEARAQDRAYRDRVLEIELCGEAVDRPPPAAASGRRVWYGGDDEPGPVERVFDALVVDLRACGLLSQGR